MAFLHLVYMNSHFQTGLRNVLDRAALADTETHSHANIPEYAKVDEIPFDFQRCIMSVVVRTPGGKDRIISKGAPSDLHSFGEFRIRRKTLPDGSRAYRRVEEGV